MKRILLTLATICLTLGAWAQDTYYAEMLSRNNYYGTARSVALGNAMTALGGDLGSIGINPAGAAVNSFGQFTITPGLVIQSTGAQWSPNGYDSYGAKETTNHTKFNIPNCGLNLVFYSDSRSDFKYVTLGFIVNTTNTFLNYMEANGQNARTSFLGNLAEAASGLKPSEMGNDLYAAFQANQFGEYGGSGSLLYAGSNEAVSADERYAYVPGMLNQNARYVTYGTKNDILINLGFNVSDKLYLGFNLGLPAVKYRREDAFTERAASPVSFPIYFLDSDGKHVGNEGEPTTYYKSSVNTYKLNTDADGIYGKFGFIWLPFEGMRLGAAIQTPSMLTIKESWQYTAQSSYENSRFDGSWNGSIQDYAYRLRTPYVFDAGMAFTFGGVGLVSLDYELTDYSVMKYKDVDSDFFSDDAWAFTNRCNSLFCGVSNSLRAGVEVRPLPEFSIRAGYSFVSDPERYAYDDLGQMVTAETWTPEVDANLRDFRYFKNNTNAFSFGVGYASSGSFFADAAVRVTRYPTLHYGPYYYGDYEVADKNGNYSYVGVPDIAYARKVVDVLLTIGWRF